MKRTKARRITRTADTCGGAYRIVGTRVTVDSVASRFRAGESHAQLAADFGVTVADVEAAVRHWIRTNAKP